MNTTHFETTTVAELIERGLIAELRQPRQETESAAVLVVDDEPVIANTLALILNNSGFNAASAYSGEEALERARTNPPDILISDVIMPGINGIELATRVRASWPDCRILLFSGSASVSDLRTTAGAQDHEFDLVAKPLHPRELLELLAAWGFPRNSSQRQSA